MSEINVNTFNTNAGSLCAALEIAPKRDHERYPDFAAQWWTEFNALFRMMRELAQQGKRFQIPAPILSAVCEAQDASKDHRVKNLNAISAEDPRIAKHAWVKTVVQEIPAHENVNVWWKDYIEPRVQPPKPKAPKPAPPAKKMGRSGQRAEDRVERNSGKEGDVEMADAPRDKGKGVAKPGVCQSVRYTIVFTPHLSVQTRQPIQNHQTSPKSKEIISSEDDSSVEDLPPAPPEQASRKPQRGAGSKSEVLEDFVVPDEDEEDPEGDYMPKQTKVKRGKPGERRPPPKFLRSCITRHETCYVFTSSIICMNCRRSKTSCNLSGRRDKKGGKWMWAEQNRSREERLAEGGILPPRNLQLEAALAKDWNELEQDRVEKELKRVAAKAAKAANESSSKPTSKGAGKKKPSKMIETEMDPKGGKRKPRTKPAEHPSEQELDATPPKKFIKRPKSVSPQEEEEEEIVSPPRPPKHSRARCENQHF
ncbi:hypothetical protein A0H81_14673 [Grifola frondosa]|uniref:Uncharacterized protein n=1 Tax=Grifola frondosa TaxID=5627 RepID=A0A1C7LKT5_GRIFR|nr:hypothetical protein A0H81_14673 [Grifola frondosa]